MTGHIELPLDFDENERWTSVGAIGQAVAVNCLTYSARNLTDGHVSLTAFRRLTVDLTSRQAAQVAVGLESIGFWQPVDGGWQVVRFEQYAYPAQKVQAYRADQAQKSRAGGRTRAATAPRDARGRMTTSVSNPTPSPIASPLGWMLASPITSPRPSPATSQTPAPMPIPMPIPPAVPIPGYLLGPAALGDQRRSRFLVSAMTRRRSHDPSTVPRLTLKTKRASLRSPGPLARRIALPVSPLAKVTGPLTPPRYRHRLASA